jgi:predicted RecA/RadA family phage recombinase
VVTEGVFDVTALTADTGNPGTKMYWDNTNSRLTTTATGNVLVGCLTAAKTSSDTTARVYLDGVIR